MYKTSTISDYVKATLEVWEREMLRKIFAGKHTEQGWQKRRINELHSMYKTATISDYIKATLEVWEKKMLRKIFGRKHTEQDW